MFVLRIFSQLIFCFEIGINIRLFLPLCWGIKVYEKLYGWPFRMGYMYVCVQNIL